MRCSNALVPLCPHHRGITLLAQHAALTPAPTRVAGTASNVAKLEKYAGTEWTQKLLYVLREHVHIASKVHRRRGK